MKYIIKTCLFLLLCSAPTIKMAAQELYKTVDKPYVIGDPNGSAVDYDVCMSEYETTISRNTVKTVEYSVSRNAYLVDLATHRRYNLIEAINAPYAPEKTKKYLSYIWVFQPLPKTCTNFMLVDGNLQLQFNLNRANGRRINHAGRKSMSAATQAVAQDMNDLVGLYYNQIGLDKNRGIFYMKKMSNIGVSVNGTMVTLNCACPSDEYDSSRVIWFDISQTKFSEEIAYGTYQGEYEKGAQRFIKISCLSGINQTDISKRQYARQFRGLHNFDTYFFWTKSAHVSKQWHNGLLWLKYTIENPNASYSDLNSTPPGYKLVVKDNSKESSVAHTRPSHSHSDYRGSSSHGQNYSNYGNTNGKTFTFYPNVANVVESDGSSNEYRKYNCPSMTVTDNTSNVRITWGGDTAVLNPSSPNSSSYSTTVSTSRGKISINAYRSSSTKELYLVSVSMANPGSGVQHITINFKP